MSKLDDTGPICVCGHPSGRHYVYIRNRLDQMRCQACDPSEKGPLDKAADHAFQLRPDNQTHRYRVVYDSGETEFESAWPPMSMDFADDWDMHTVSTMPHGYGIPEIYSIIRVDQEKGT